MASTSKFQNGSRFSLLGADKVVSPMNNSSDTQVPISVASGDLQRTIQEVVQVEQHEGATGNLSEVFPLVSSTPVECSGGLPLDTSNVSKPGQTVIPHVALETRDVASGSKVIPLTSSLNHEKHTVVQVVANGKSVVLREKNCRVLPGSIRDLSSKGSGKVLMGGRGVQKSSLILKKHDARDSFNASLARRMSALESELTATQAKVASSVLEDLPPAPYMDSNVS
ncbi:hypothetical protein V6N12_067727 [Hibiscus sabdariffa]|uniref:Uncharacterized protein n=1 Tax=Hibiscus sabdariffa TaxID=183260 RepID=A0ABR2FN61_9ROSI